MIDFSKFTVSNGAITDLRELIYLTVFKNPDIDLLVTTKTGVKDKQKLDFVDSLGDVGLSGGGCDPSYSKVVIQGIEKEWNLGAWEIAKHICYKDIENTLGEIGINTGTDVADLNGTPYMDLVIELLRRAVTEMAWRIIWFADLEAKNVADSGILSAGIDPKLFNMCDGLWKRLSAIIAENEHQQTIITANTDMGDGADTTYASQKEAIRKEGYALKLVDTLLSDADSRIFDGENASIYMTSSVFKALRSDVVAHYTKATMPYEQVASGLHLSEYDGVRIVVCDIWDRMIKKYEDTGTCLNNPHRAIVCNPSNLFVGTNDVDKIPELRLTFSDVDRKNYIYATSKIDTLVGEDALVQVAI